MGINVAPIPYEWQNLKSKSCPWVNRNKNLFPHKSWYEIGEKVNNLGFNNLFHLVDFLLCHSMSSAEAERAFSGMKNIKTDKRTKLNNKLLTMQLWIKLCGVDIKKFNPEKLITCWELKPSRRNTSTSIQAKWPQFTENQEASTVFDPKKKQKFEDTIFIDCTDIIIAI